MVPLTRPEIVTDAVAPDATAVPHAPSSTFENDVAVVSFSTHRATGEMASVTVALKTTVVELFHAPAAPRLVVVSLLNCASALGGDAGAVVSMPKSVAAVRTSLLPPKLSHPEYRPAASFVRACQWYCVAFTPTKLAEAVVP